MATCRAAGGLAPTQMVEFLRRSVEGLEPPDCVACHTPMAWYRSLRPPGETELIVHYFQCPNCNRIAEIRTRVPAADGNGKTPPSPSRGAAAAA